MLKEGMFIQDRYEIISKIGSGGMADVYKAKDHTLNRFVAVKVLKPEFRKDKGFITKFRVEAQSAAGLAHPNIVNVYDVGEDNGISFIVMELVEGITLKEYIEKKGRLAVREATSIADPRYQWGCRRHTTTASSIVMSNRRISSSPQMEK